MKMYMQSWWKSSFTIGGKNYAELIHVEKSTSAFYEYDVTLYLENSNRKRMLTCASSHYRVYDEKGNVIGKIGDLFDKDGTLK